MSWNNKTRNLAFVFQVIIATLATLVSTPSSFAADKTELNTASSCSGPWGTSAGTFNGPANKVYAPYGVTITKATISFHTIGNGYNTSSLTIYTHNSGTGFPGSSLGTLNYSSVSGSVATLTGNVTIPSAGNYWVQYNTPTGGYYNCYTNTVNYSGSADGWTLIRGMVYGTAGSGSAATSWANWGGQYGFQMNFTLYSTVTIDNTAPTFPSSDTFNVAENTTSVGTVTTSESATITIFGGEDQAKFSISRLTDSSTALSFSGSPNFEAPTDVGANNSYVVVLKAVDGASNAGYETVTVTVTDVVDTSSFNSFTIASAPVFRSVVQVSANISVPAKVTFKVNNVRIPGCIGLRTSGTSPNIVATCNWKPSKRGTSVITAVATPTTAGIAPTTSTLLQMNVARRTGTR